MPETSDLERRHGDYLLSSDPARFDHAAIHAALTASYWATGVPPDVVRRSLEHSIAIGAYLLADGPDAPDGRGGQQTQVGLIRAVTDRATFAWLCDVYVLPEHQGRGLAQAMVAALLEHPELQGLRRWLLATRDAHGLYARFGFEPLPEPQRYLQLPSRAEYGAGRPPSDGGG